MKNLYQLLLSLTLLGWNVQYLSAQSTTFNYTGSVQYYTVGPGVISVGVDCKGAQGGSFVGWGVGGNGGRVQCTLAVTPGQVLSVYVGQVGTDGVCCGGPIPPGGTNSGGGAQGGAGSNSDGGSAGGGSSDIRTIAGSTTAALNSRLIVAGGGGGGAFACGADNGGAGGNATGGLGIECGSYNASAEGTPGTATTGGSAGSLGGTPGGFGFGGDAYPTFWGGGGGGGWYGAGGAYEGGGCGGSSHVAATGITATTMTAGFQTGNGQVILTVICAIPTGGTIVGAPALCVGTTTPLSDPTGTAGGTWTSSDPLIASIGSSTGIVTGVAPGVATITYSIVLSCGSASATRTITVNPLPSPIFGSTGICTGSTTTLFDTTAGGTWSSTFTSIATVNSTSGVVTGVTIGSTNVSYTLASTGCATGIVVTVVGLAGPTEVCATDSITLTATSPSGTWSSSNTDIAVVDTTGKVKGLSMGTVHISYTLPTGCTATWLITVNPLAPILGTDSVCVGGNRYLTDIVGGGVWTSSTTSVATITPDSGHVVGLLAGVTNVTYLLPTGCMATVPLNVIDNPPAILGVMIACPNSTTTLADAVGGGTWTSGNTSIATVDAATGIVTGLAADTVDIFYTISPGCTTGTTVTINPLPAPVTGRSVICPGTKDTLYDATLYGSWSTVTPTLSSVDAGGVVTAMLASGAAVIRYTLPITGCYQEKTITIEPLPAPVITYNWLDATLYATPGYAHYQWYDSSTGLIPGATVTSVAASVTDYYWVVVTDSNGCKGVSSLFYYNTSMVGVKNINGGAAVRVYPNPANDVVYFESTIKIRAVVSTLQGKTEIEDPDAHEMNISRLPPGIYLITLYDAQNNRIGVDKLVKE